MFSFSYYSTLWEWTFQNRSSSVSHFVAFTHVLWIHITGPHIHFFLFAILQMSIDETVILASLPMRGVTYVYILSNNFWVSVTVKH